jgi:hypothetical protein
MPAFIGKNPRAWRENIAGDGGGRWWREGMAGRSGGKGGDKGRRETRRCEREREKIWPENNGGEVPIINLKIHAVVGR